MYNLLLYRYFIILKQLYPSFILIILSIFVVVYTFKVGKKQETNNYLYLSGLMYIMSNICNVLNRCPLTIKNNYNITVFH